MMWNFITLGISSLVSNIFGIFKKKIPDATVNEIDTTAENITATAAQATTANAGALNVRAEEQGEPWLQRNWRPTLMMLLIAIIANNTFGVAYLHAKEIVMTAQMWNFLSMGLGGYIGCRTVEKIVKVIKG